MKTFGEGTPAPGSKWQTPVPVASSVGGASRAAWPGQAQQLGTGERRRTKSTWIVRKTTEWKTQTGNALLKWSRAA